MLSLGLDTLAVSVALGIGGLAGGKRWRVASAFALFEGAMPLIGFLAGAFVGRVLGGAASIAGIVILSFVGCWMVFEALHGEDNHHFDVAGWRSLALTSLSVSLDELTVGFSLGLLKTEILLAAALICAQAFILTFAGVSIGNRIGARLADRASLAAGLVLVALALIVLVERL